MATGTWRQALRDRCLRPTRAFSCPAERSRRARLALQALPAVLIVGLAAWLRLQRLDLVQFLNDEAQALLFTEDAVRLGSVPLTGLVTSVGLQSPPTFIYLLTPVVALSRDPAVASAAIALANAAAVGGLIALAWRRLSWVAGLVAGLDLATHPWAVLASRKIWPNDLLAPWAVLLLVALDRGVIAGERWWSALAVPIFALGVEIHVSFGLLAPLLVAPIGQLVLRRGWVHLGVGLAAAALTMAPYALHVWQTGGADLGLGLTVARTPATLDAASVGLVQRLTSTWDNVSLVGLNVERLLPGRVLRLAAGLHTALLGGGLLAAAAGVLGVGSLDRRRRWQLGGLLLWLLLPVALTLRHAVPLYEYYFFCVLPASALLVAVGPQWLVERRGAVWAPPALGLVLGCVLVVAAIQTLTVVRFLQDVSDHYEPGYAAPLAVTRALARQLGDFAARGQASTASIEVQEPQSVPIAYLLRPALRRGEVVDLGDLGAGERFASPRLTSVLGGLGEAAAAPRPGVPGLAADEQPGLVYPDGVRVLAAAPLAGWGPGESAGLALIWSAPRPTVATVRWAVALYGPDGAVIQRKTGLVHQAGDALAQPVVSWFSLPTETGAPSGSYTVGLSRVDASGAAITYATASGTAGSEWRSAPVIAQPR